MKAALQKQIAPASSNATQKLSNADVSDQTSVQTNKDNQIDFKSVLMESNSAVARKREARKNGDLSTADSYESFLEELAAQTEQKNAPKNTMDKNDFLTLFVTQLQQQDPLNPQDGTEMAAQLAQFNSLEQMMNVNTTLQSLVSAQENSKKLQFLNYVGKEVSVDGGKIALNNGEINDVSFYSDRELGRSTMVVKDSNGQEVFKKELGVLGAGKHKLTWDGNGSDGKRRADGIYSVEVKAMSGNGDPIQVAMNSSVKIKGVDLVQDGNNLYTDIGPINFADVLAVGERGFKTATDTKTAEGVTTLTEKDQAKALQEAKKAGEDPAQKKADNGKNENSSVASPTASGTKSDAVKAEMTDSEMLKKANSLAEQMGFSLKPPVKENQNSPDQPTQQQPKSGRIPITSGQHANAPVAAVGR